MAITGIDTLDGKQIIAAGASSAVKAAQDGNGNIITATYQTTAGMSNYATTASVTGKQDALTFNYNGSNLITGINSSGIATGGSFPTSADAACQVVTANSANWGDIPTKVVASSADATGSNILYVVTGS